MNLALIPLIGFLAFTLKGITGTGTTTVIVALCSLLIEPKMTIVLASFVNVFGGLSMIKIDPVPLPMRYWIPISILMVIGSILGAWALKVIPKEIFEMVLGIAFLFVSAWFIAKKVVPLTEETSPPQKASLLDLAIGLFGGFCGGFIGVNAPPLVFHFGMHLNKRQLRRLLVLIFIPAAIAQTLTFWWAGMMSQEILIYGLAILPCMVAGIYAGNKAFHKISENLFRRVLGLLLLIVSARLIF